MAARKRRQSGCTAQELFVSFLARSVPVKRSLDGTRAPSRRLIQPVQNHDSDIKSLIRIRFAFFSGLIRENLQEGWCDLRDTRVLLNTEGIHGSSLPHPARICTDVKISERVGGITSIYYNGQHMVHMVHFVRIYSESSRQIRFGHPVNQSSLYYSR